MLNILKGLLRQLNYIINNVLKLIPIIKKLNIYQIYF